MSRNRKKSFDQLHALSQKLDKVSASDLDLMIRSNGDASGGLYYDEAIYRLAVEVAYFRKKEQLGYVQ